MYPRSGACFSSCVWQRSAPSLRGIWPIHTRQFQHRDRREARQVIQRLEPSARAGDSHSALLIALKLMDCHEIIAHQDDENSLIADAQRLGGLENALQKRSERHADCVSLGSQDYERRGEWLTLAAREGNINAQLLYASAADLVLGSPAMMLKHPERVIAYKGQALEYLRSAAATGSVDA